MAAICWQLVVELSRLHRKKDTQRNTAKAQDHDKVRHCVVAFADDGNEVWDEIYRQLKVESTLYCNCQACRRQEKCCIELGQL